MGADVGAVVAGDPVGAGVELIWVALGVALGAGVLGVTSSRGCG